MEGHEGTLANHEWTAHADPADRVDPVEDDELDAGLLRGFHGESHGRDVGEEAAPDVLHVEDEGIETREVGGPRFAPRDAGIKAVDLQAGFPVDTILDVAFQLAANSVFRSEEGPQIQLPGIVEKIDRGLAFPAQPGLVGNQTDLESLQVGKAA